MNVSAADNFGIVSYDYEIIHGDGYLSGNNTATEKIYHAGNNLGNAIVQVTISDAAGYSAKEILYIPVKDTGYQKISNTQGNFTETLYNNNYFGNSVTTIGDLDGDGISEIAVGSPDDNDGGSGKGAIWILFLNKDGTVKNNGVQKISETQGNFSGTLDNNDAFGFSVSKMYTDKNNCSIIVGARGDDDGGENRGAVWILYLNSDGTVVH